MRRELVAERSGGVKEGRRVGKRGKRQRGRYSIKMEKCVNISVAGKNSIRALALKAWAWVLIFFVKTAWRHTQTTFGGDIEYEVDGFPSIHKTMHFMVIATGFCRMYKGDFLGRNELLVATGCFRPCIEAES